MNSYARRIVMDRARGRDYGHGGEYYGEFRGDYEMDGRRGVKGTGRYGIGGSRYYGRDRAREYDYDDYGRGEDYARRGGMRDGHHEGGEDMYLSPRELKEWGRELENADGTRGEHYDSEQIEQVAERLGIRYKNFDEKEFALTVNMMYSDYCEALRGAISPEKELVVYAKMAKAWLEDKDSIKGGEKLSAYRAITCDE